MAWRLEPARPDDLAPIAALEAAVFREPLSQAELEALWARPDVTYVVFRDGPRLAAYFGFQVTGPTAHVISNATDPAYRRRGLGSRILREAEPLARAKGARWYLGEVRVSNAEQRRILAQLGWSELGVCPRFFRDGEDAVVVWRLIEDGR